MKSFITATLLITYVVITLVFTFKYIEAPMDEAPTLLTELITYLQELLKLSVVFYLGYKTAPKGGQDGNPDNIVRGNGTDLGYNPDGLE